MPIENNNDTFFTELKNIIIVLYEGYYLQNLDGFAVNQSKILNMNFDILIFPQKWFNDIRNIFYIDKEQIYFNEDLFVLKKDCFPINKDDSKTNLWISTSDNEEKTYTIDSKYSADSSIKELYIDLELVSNSDFDFISKDIKHITSIKRINFIEVNEDDIVLKILSLWRSMSQNLSINIKMKGKIEYLKKFEIKAEIESIKKIKKFRWNIFEKTTITRIVNIDCFP